MAYHVRELPLYPADELAAQLNALPAAWTLHTVCDAVPVQLRQNRSQVKTITKAGVDYTQISPTAIFIFVE